MSFQNSRSSIIWYEGIGFCSLIVLSWLDEFYGLQQFLLGGPQHLADWRDCVMDSLLILVVWAAIYLFTKRLLSHLLYLEGFLRVCSWCRRINYQGEWIGIEDYFAQGFRVETTHGMCSDCFKKGQQEIATFWRTRRAQESMADDAAQRPDTDRSARP